MIGQRGKPVGISRALLLLLHAYVFILAKKSNVWVL